MAITAATMTSDFDAGFLTPEMSAPFFAQAARQSVAMRLARQVPVGINGNKIPVTSGMTTAAWVGEGERKPATEMSVELKFIEPKKMACIAVVSAETVRANPGGYMQLLQTDIGDAFAFAFDQAVFHGTNTPFDDYLDETSKAVELGGSSQALGGVYRDFVEALDLVVSDTSAIDGAPRARRKLTGWALDSMAEPTMLGAVDTTGRPLFVDMPSQDTASQITEGRILRRPAFIGEGVATPNGTTVVGYGGDWTQVVWGVTSGISYGVSTQATVTINGSLVSLWENNLVAIKAEAEYGFLINDIESFVRLMNLTGS